MDRFSIIQKQVFNQPVVVELNNCGQDQCVCEDVSPRLKKIHLLELLIVTIAAFIVAFTMKGNMTHENTLSFKKMATISCSSKTNGSDGQLPGDKNNKKNTCSHQQGFICESNNPKRKSLKTHNC